MCSTRPSLITVLLFFLVLPAISYSAEIALPQSISEQAGEILTKVGRGTYRKFGFRVYDATLWAPRGKWKAEKPYALQLVYARDLSKETLVETVIENIEEQGVADEVILSRWKEILNNALCEVKEGDALTGLAIPGKKTLLFYNDNNIASIDDQTLSNAFFAIWLGDHADKDLRNKLLGNI